MAISRQQLTKELEPGLNALFGLEYSRYENEHAEIYQTETSDRAFEEEVMLSGFGSAPVKQEGATLKSMQQVVLRFMAYQLVLAPLLIDTLMLKIARNYRNLLFVLTLQVLDLQLSVKLFVL